jgi:hypothetical protein
VRDGVCSGDEAAARRAVIVFPCAGAGPVRGIAGVGADSGGVQSYLADVDGRGAEGERVS